MNNIFLLIIFLFIIISIYYNIDNSTINTYNNNPYYNYAIITDSNDFLNTESTDSTESTDTTE